VSRFTIQLLRVEMEIGKRIKELREYLGLSQREFADILGIHPLSISRYESGKSNPAPSVLKLIEDKFSVNPEWLREGKGDLFLKKDSANFNFEFNKRWKDLDSILEKGAKRIVDTCLELFMSKKQKERLNIEVLEVFLKNKVKRNLMNEAKRSLDEILALTSCLENASPFDKFKNK